MPKVTYRTQVQTYGWQAYVSDGKTSGTVGKAKRLEAIQIKLQNNTGIEGGITYQTHVQKIGWQAYVSNGALSGTVGKAYRLESIRIKLTGDLANYYDVMYRVQVQKTGWQKFVKNGADAVDALGGQVPQRLLVHFDLLVPVGAAVLDRFHDGKRLHDAPAHTVTLDILAQVADLLPRPHLPQRNVVQGGHDALHADLPQHRQRDLVFLTEPSPGFFHGMSAF